MVFGTHTAVATGENALTSAHEKIAADLGHSLGLPVAPVLLSKETKGHGLPDVVALSFATLKQPSPWTPLAAGVSDTHKAMLRPALAGMLGFHAWIDDHDHNWHDGNALFECDPDGTVRAVFYDYGHSLLHQWKPPAAAPARAWAARNGPFAMLKSEDVTEIVERIEQFPVKDLEAIITRIPAECLAPDLGKSLIAGLTDRRANVGGLLKGAP